MAIVNPVSQAKANLKEAQRQLADAQTKLKQGVIPQSRVDELTRLRDAADEDLKRSIKEFGPNIPEEEQWEGNFRPY